MSRTVRVSASKSYDVIIENGSLPRVGEAFLEIGRGKTVCVVSDDKVHPLYGEMVENSLLSAGYKVEKFIIPNGEASKTPENYLRLVSFLAQRALSAGDTVAALGGGVVGDLAGFASATYRRGIGFVQLPTTLLAAVDSSVGGKTAVDLPQGKNLLGAFYQPELVLLDCDTFKTLEKSTFTDGCAEVIKYGMIRDKSLFERLSDTSKAASEDVIYRCVEIKRDVVEADERDTGLRKILNFGHTVGHAIESLSDFGITHGSAVAIGMSVMTAACVKNRLCGEGCLARLTDLLNAYGLPTKTDFTARELANAMTADKKRSGDTIDLIILRDIGECGIRKTAVSELEGFIAGGLE